MKTRVLGPIFALLFVQSSFADSHVMMEYQFYYNRTAFCEAADRDVLIHDDGSVDVYASVNPGYCGALKKIPHDSLTSEEIKNVKQHISEMDLTQPMRDLDADVPFCASVAASYLTVVTADGVVHPIGRTAECHTWVTKGSKTLYDFAAQIFRSQS